MTDSIEPTIKRLEQLLERLDAHPAQLDASTLTREELTATADSARQLLIAVAVWMAKRNREERDRA